LAGVGELGGTAMTMATAASIRPFQPKVTLEARTRFFWCGALHGKRERPLSSPVRGVRLFAGNANTVTGVSQQSVSGVLQSCTPRYIGPGPSCNHQPIPVTAPGESMARLPRGRFRSVEISAWCR
jgi:hypothetical protein